MNEEEYYQQLVWDYQARKIAEYERSIGVQQDEIEEAREILEDIESGKESTISWGEMKKRIEEKEDD